MSFLEVQHVSKRFGRTNAVLDVSFELELGSVLGLAGPNGAGKSTLLRALLGLIPPAQGTIRVGGHTPRVGRADVGYCPQLRTLDRDTPLRASDLVGLGLDGHRWGFGGHSRAERDRRVREALADVGAVEYADASVGQLSGGEQQRLGIAQALLSRLRLLLLDEPLASLDLKSQAEIVSLVDRLRREHSMAVLFVTHGINPVLEAIDRVCYLANGRAALGTVDEVITSESLSALYGAPVEVVRAGGRIFVTTDDETHV